MLSFYLSLLESEPDRQAFRTIYETYNELMCKTAWKILQNESDVEDAVQNAYLQVIKHFEKAISIPCDELPAWLIIIVRNEAYMVLRKNRRTIPLEDWDGSVDDIDDYVGYQRLIEVFRKLPVLYRSVLEMKLLIGYSNAEIAERLGISETAVSTRASRGRVELRKLVESEGYLRDGSGIR